jgi:hypothetical protein
MRQLLYRHLLMMPRRCGRVLLDSFISTQKQSVQRAMAKKFRKYVSYKRDFHDLVMAALQGLLRDQQRREQVSGLDPTRLGPAIAVQMRRAVRCPRCCTLVPFYWLG